MPGPRDCATPKSVLHHVADYQHIGWLTVAAALDVSVTERVAASPTRVRAIMFDPRQDPTWMAAVKRVEPLTDEFRPGARVRRVGTFLGRTLRWTTEVIAVSRDARAEDHRRTHARNGDLSDRA